MHELLPKLNERTHSNSEIIEFLEIEFNYVVVNRTSALIEHKEMIEFMEDAINRGATAYTLESIEELKSKDPGVAITIADKENYELCYLSTLLVEGEPLSFGYEGGEHEDAAKPILERVAEILNYEITEY